MQDLSTILGILPKIGWRYLFYLRSQWWDKEKMEAYQDKCLRKLIRHAGRHVSYYRELFGRIGLDPETFRGRVDIPVIPLLDKETLRRDPEDFIADNAGKFSPKWIKTSGSTGTPLEFMMSADCRANDAAATIRAYQWAGYYPGMRIFSVKGFLSDWEFKYNMLGTSLNFDSVQLTSASAIRVLNEIQKLKPQVYHGYPFALSMLSKIAEDEGIGIPCGSCVIVGGETLTEDTRERVKAVYGDNVFDVYSMMENAVMITQCREGSKHVIEDYAYHEFVNGSGQVITEGRGEIVGTGYYNRAMPLIRYRTRDYASLGGASAGCPCGRQFRVVQTIEGRKEDFIQTPDGRFVNLIEGAISMGKGIVTSQYVQDTPEHMYVNIVPDAEFKRECLVDIERGLRVRVGNAIRIDFKIVEELERTEAGKTPFLVSRIGSKFSAV